MGLFDFITKTASGNASQATQSTNGSTTTQGYQDDDQQNRLVQTPFSDVKYPLPPVQEVQQQYAQPDANLQYPQQDTTLNYQNQYPQAEPLTQAQMDNNQMVSDLSMSAQQRSEMSQPQVSQEFPQPAQQDNAGFLQYNPQFDNSVSQTAQMPDLTQTTGFQSQTAEMPAATMPGVTPETGTELPPLPDINNNESTLPASTMSAPAISVPDITDLPAASTLDNTISTPIDGAVAPVAEPTSQPEAAMPETQTQPETSTEDSMKDTLETGTMSPEGATAPEVAEVPAVETPTAEMRTGNETPATEMPEAVDSTVTETVAPETQSGEPTPEVTPAAEPLVIEPIAAAPVTTSAVEAASVMPEVTEKVADTVVQGGPEDETVDLDKEIFNNIETAVKTEFEKGETQEKQVDAIEVLKETPAFKVFKNIAFVGLNVESTDQSMSEKLIDVIRMLSVNKPNFILDSGKGYGEVMLNKLLEHKDVGIKGAYLKPFYSDYTDEPKVKINTENYSTAMFSNLDSKLKYLIKAADIFVVPETKGISNISMLFALLSNAYLYFGQHKPILLLGEGWTNTIQSLKSTLQFSDMEAGLFTICATPAELMAHLLKLDAEYSGKTKVSVNKVIDMRNEGDESEYFVNNF